MTFQPVYIPDRFKTTFRGFPRKYPYEAIEAQKRKEKREQLLRYRKAYVHKSRGWHLLRREVLSAIKKGITSDWVYNGEDEYEVEQFSVKLATRKVFDLLRKKGLLKYIR